MCIQCCKIPAPWLPHAWHIFFILLVTLIIRLVLPVSVPICAVKY